MLKKKKFKCDLDSDCEALFRRRSYFQLTTGLKTPINLVSYGSRLPRRPQMTYTCRQASIMIQGCTALTQQWLRGDTNVQYLLPKVVAEAVP